MVHPLLIELARVQDVPLPGLLQTASHMARAVLEGADIEQTLAAHGLPPSMALTLIDYCEGEL